MTAEKAVLEVLAEVLRDWPELEERLLTHVKKQIELAGQEDGLLRAKQEQCQAVRDQLLLYARSFTPKTQAALEPEIHRPEAERDALDMEIAMHQKQNSVAKIDPSRVVAAMKDELLRLSDQVKTLAPNALAGVLAAFTAKLEADMETKDVVFAFHLPAWMALEAPKTGLVTLCTSTSSESSTGAYTQHDPTLYIPLGSGTCRFIYRQGTADCKCCRSDRKKAA